MTRQRGAYEINGRLFFQLGDGSSISCNCIRDTCASQVAAACSVNRELLRALMKYGRHLKGCRWDAGGWPCTCGFNASLGQVEP